MKVVHVVSRFDISGVATVVTDLLPSLQQQGVEAELWHFGTASRLRERSRSMPYPVHEICSHGSLRRRIGLLKERINTSGAEIVHLHDLSAPLLLAARGCEVPVVAHIHQAPPRQLYRSRTFSRLWFVRHVLRPALLRRMDAVIACSDAAVEFAKRQYHIPEERLRVVRNAVDVRRISGSRSSSRCPRTPRHDAVHFTYLGRLDPIKDLPMLFTALQRIRAQVPAWHLTILGDGPMRGELEASAAALEIADRVTFCGEVLDPLPFLEASDLLVHPSASEGLSISVLEAMALGLPVVACNVGGNTETISDGHDGLLTPPGDAEQFAAACRRLCLDTQLREQMGRAARQTVEASFNIGRMASEIVDCYTDVLSQPIISDAPLDEIKRRVAL